MSRVFAIIIGLLVAVPALAESPAIDPAAAQFFESKIRPVLADHCYKCHSAQALSAGKLKGELLLDSREGVLRGGKSGPVIVAGKPKDSRLIEAIHYTNPDLKMPPKDQLEPAAVADLEKWVAMGAPDPRNEAAPALKPAMDVEAGKKFWSFQPLHRVEPPAVQADAGWARTPIDKFVLAMQQQKGLKPNPATSRDKLIRRAYFDLVGLPPAPEEVAAFIGDKAPDAYDRLIDRLMANPHYGERWARHWLDVARFGESDGFEQDYDRPAAYQYRDFLIRALNSDMPFDRFVQLQIAGDEIAPDDWQAMAATGFLTAGVFPTQITEKEFESSRYNQLDDMISTLGNAMLGLTVGCARCHDHKYDPIATLDYYRLAATFGTAIRSDVEMDLTTPQQREKNKAEWDAKIADLRQKIDALDKGEIEKKFNERIADAGQKPDSRPADAWSVLTFDTIKTANGAKLMPQVDGSLLLEGKAPTKDSYTLVAHTDVRNMTSLQLEALADKSLPYNGPGAGGNGNFALTEIEISAAPADGSKPAVPIKIASAIATFEQNKSSLSIASSFDGNSGTGWAVDGQIGKDQAAIFNFDKPVDFPGGAVLTVVLHFDHQSPHHLIGRARLSVSSQQSPHFAENSKPNSAIAKIFARLAAGEKVTPAQRELARKSISSSIKEYTESEKDLAKLEADGPAKEMTTVQVTSEGLKPVKNHADDRGYPHFYKTVYLLRRGDPANKVQPISYGFPRVLTRGGKDDSTWEVTPPKSAHTSYQRTGLAHWLTDVDNGAGNLLARVIVNRLWQHHFGQGIVATPNDFGAQGERPISPELLDWLANDLIDHGWQLKRLHKLMMTSAVYMQDAQSDAARTAIDPHDTYLWRWQPRRLEAEPIRDSLLAVSGVLDETMFGPGTLDQNSTRRSIYFRVKRSQLIPMMMVLDWPEALNSIGSRPVTTVAPQALLFMNSAQARQYAEAFAKRIHSESVPESIDRAYHIAFARSPEKAETEMAQAFIEKQAASYREAKRGNAQEDAMADFCQALMSGNEFVYVD